MTADEVLLLTADYIEEHGLLQGAFGQPGEACCVRGAILAVTDERDSREAIRALVEYLDLNSRAPNTAVVAWNDTPGRSADEVIAALRGAAASLTGARL